MFFRESIPKILCFSCIYAKNLVTLHAKLKTMIVAFTTSLPEEGFARLKAEGRGQDIQCVMPDAEGTIHDADILVSTFDYKVTREMIDSMPNLKLIANFGVGFNNIDLDACRERGIRVTNTPHPVIEPTAELCFSLMHAVARRTAELDRRLRMGTAEPFGVMNNLGHSLYGKTLGIIGMGHIGSAVARRAIASGMQVIYHNRHKVKSVGRPSADPRLTLESPKYVELDDLLRESDFVSLNLPYTPATHHIIDATQLAMMKPTAYLINTARGAHVNERALVRALREGQIAGAAMDVYEFEPSITAELLTMDNVVLSPHVGTGTWEGRIAMCENVTDNILAFIHEEDSKMDLVPF